MNLETLNVTSINFHFVAEHAFVRVALWLERFIEHSL